MGLSEEDWARFGRWMMIVGGLTSISLALYHEQNMVSSLLKIWVAAFGIYCVYLGFFK